MEATSKDKSGAADWAKSDGIVSAIAAKSDAAIANFRGRIGVLRMRRVFRREKHTTGEIEIAAVEYGASEGQLVSRVRMCFLNGY